MEEDRDECGAIVARCGGDSRQCAEERRERLTLLLDVIASLLTITSSTLSHIRLLASYVSLKP